MNWLESFRSKILSCNSSHLSYRVLLNFMTNPYGVHESFMQKRNW